MKIAHVVSYFQPEFGYEEYYSAREQAKLGHEVHVITSDRIFPFKNVEKMLKDIGSPYEDRERPEGVEEMEGFTVHRGPTRMEVLFDFIIYGGVEDTLARLEPDVVHAHGLWQWGSYKSAKIKDRIGFKLILDEHGYSTTYDQGKSIRNWLLDKEYRTLRQPYAKYTLKRSDRVVAVSSETEEFLRDHYGVKEVEMIPLGVDHRRFCPDEGRRRKVREEMGLEGKFVLVTAGRMDRAKRIHLFSDALRSIEDPDLRLIVVGTGDEEYLSEIREGADDRVSFLGFKRPDELADLYNAADLGVWGKASITIREAMGCGLPLLLLDTPDMRSLVKWDNGIMVKPDRIPDVISGLKSDVRLKEMGENGRKAVEEELSVEVEAKRLLDVYRG